MPLKLYNTLSGTKETFDLPKDHIVTMYNCGPTVYNYAHIGNLRAYVFTDILRRTLEYNGYTVKQVMNLTDVGHLTSDADDGDDKMVKALKRLEKPMTLEAMREVADIYAEAFKMDLQALSILTPHEMPRASDHIQDDIELVRMLEERGFAYRIRDGLYFDTSKFPAYGRLGNVNLEGQQAGARVEVKSDKKNQRDFTLWKLSSNELGWESPWGKGFPGWHIECSAMSRKYLGQPFDIHTGGIDHIPVHHNNEIAQSQAAYDTPLANIWMHNEHLIIAEGKMAKSGENFVTLQTLQEKGIHPLAFRYYLLQTHYRSPLNFSWEALQASQKAYFRLLYRFSKLAKKEIEGVSQSREAVLQIINDDLDTPALLSQMLTGFQTLTESWGPSTALDYDKILGLDIENQSRKLAKEMETAPEEVKALITKREEARAEKNFKLSDELRDQIEKEGYEIMDTDSGPVARKKFS